MEPVILNMLQKVQEYTVHQSLTCKDFAGF